MSHIVPYILVAAIVVAIVLFVLRRGNKAGFDAAAAGATSQVKAELTKEAIAVRKVFSKGDTQPK